MIRAAVAKEATWSRAFVVGALMKTSQRFPLLLSLNSSHLPSFLSSVSFLPLSQCPRSPIQLVSQTYPHSTYPSNDAPFSFYMTIN